MNRLAILVLAFAAQANSAFAADPPPTRSDARLLTFASNECINPAVVESGDGAESFVSDAFLPNVAMGVYDALTAALDEAGRDKERVSVAVLNISNEQPRCFQVALSPEYWRSSAGRRTAERLALTGPANDEADLAAFPFLAEFYIRRQGTAIAIGASVLRYHEPIWRNFQSPANDIVATFVISRPGQTKSQTISLPLGGSTRREDNGYRLFGVGGAEHPTLDPVSETLWISSPFSTPITNDDDQKDEDGAENAVAHQPPPETASPSIPVTLTIQLRELKDGNPVAALLAGALRGSRTAASNELSPTARAQARATELTSDISAINTYSQALTAYHTAYTTYCAPVNDHPPSETDLRTRNPAPLWAAHQVLLQYAQSGIGTAPTTPMVDLNSPNAAVCAR